MRLGKIVRHALAGGATLAMALGLVSCSRDYTVGYVYAVSTSNPSTISAYAIDYQTGILNQIAGSPFSTSFTNASTVVAAPNNKFVYLIGGSNNAQVAEYAVGTDGKLYGQNTYNLTGTAQANTTNGPPFRVAAAIDTTGTFLYVASTYQNGYSPASPGPGNLTIFPINADNSLGTPTTLNIGNNPVGITVSTPVCVAAPIIASNPTCSGLTGGGSGVDNVYVYVLDQEVTAAKPTILGFAQNMSTGALTPLAGTNTTANPMQGYAAGVTPTAIAVDGTARFVYVTDQEQNVVLGYSIARATTGDLTPLSGSPFGTGQFPVNLTIDPRAEYEYTANFNSGTVSEFAISQATGNLTAVAGSTFSVKLQPTCVTIEPSLGLFTYVTDFGSGDIAGGELNANTGALNATTDSPYPTSALPACGVAVATGAHAISVLTP